MEKKNLEFTEEISTLLDVGRRLLGNDKETVIETVTQSLLTSRVDHQAELGLAKNREVHFLKKKKKSARRRGTPTQKRSLLRAMAQLVEQHEEKQLSDPHAKPMGLWPQAYCDRYSLELTVRRFESPMAAATVAMMIEHEFKEREAHAVFEIVTQHTAPQKTPSKFYEKRKQINLSVKERFDKSNFFQVAPSGKEILLAPLSETEARATYAFQELCARLLGPPVFPTLFNPKETIPELISTGRNFDEQNAVEDLQIRAFNRPSLQNINQSLGNLNMEKKARGPVLNTVISGNGRGGIHGTPLAEESEADKQAAINRVVNDYVSSVGLRRSLKNPKLEVLVDGKPIAAPFATSSHTVRHFELSALAKYVQIFATQHGRRVIVSNLALTQTEISRGSAWHSELELEGQQKIRLSVEPRMDESGNLTGADLVVGYWPMLTLSDRLRALPRWGSTLVGELWPAWAGTPSLSFAIGVLALVPFFILFEVFSFRALVMLVLLMTAFFFVTRKVKPAWDWVWSQQVAVHSFVSVMLIGMLSLGFLPTNCPFANTGATVNTSTPQVGSTGGGNNWFGSTWGQPLFYYSDHGSTWEPTVASALWSDVARVPVDNGSGTYLIVRNFQGGLDPSTYYSSVFVGDNQAFIWSLVQPRVAYIWPQSGGGEQVALVNDQASVRNKQRRTDQPAPALSPTPVQAVALHESIHIDVLVDTTQLPTLIRNSSPVSPIVETVASGATARVATSETNAKKVEAETRSAAETQPTMVETANRSGASPGVVMTAKETPALVVFESPTGLGSLSKNDRLNANFKSIGLSTPAARGEMLVCTATGVVEDITTTGGTDVQVRVKLVLTWESGGNTVNRELQLLLTALLKNIENSHYGVLAAPPTIGNAVARNDVRRSPLPKQR